MRVRVVIVVFGIFFLLSLGVFFLPLPKPGPDQQAVEKAAPAAQTDTETSDLPATLPEPAKVQRELHQSGLIVSSDELVVDSATRAAIEKLSAVQTITELYEVKADLAKTLPDAAAVRAADLVDRYYRYRIALKERIPGTEVAPTPQDAAFALDRLHALRVEFFGEELAKLWFADEEAIGRKMIADAPR